MQLVQLLLIRFKQIQILEWEEKDQYQIIVDRPGALDTFAVKVELKEKFQKTKIDKEKLIANIKTKIRDITGLSAALEIVACGELPRSAGKAKHVLDLRKGKM